MACTPSLHCGIRARWCLVLIFCLGNPMAALANEGNGFGLLFDAGLTLDDNVTRAKEGNDRLSDSAYSVNISKSKTLPLGTQSRVVLAGVLGGERFQTYTGLSHLDAALEAELQYRESAEFSAPTLGIFAKLKVEDYESNVRDGYRYSLGLSYSQPLTDRISLFAALASNQRYSSSKVFTTVDTSARMSLDYALSARNALYMSAEYRVGDVVSSGRASLENVTISKVFVLDNAFTGGQFFSYKINGSTWLTTVGYNYSLGSSGAIDIAWRRVESTPELRPSWATSPRSYISNQLLASYLFRF
ncbi:MAG: hypothetical protein U5O12_20700 [Rhodoferax sp.]|nr:hypothetical protein [Rhodoferax sp.]